MEKILHTSLIIHIAFGFIALAAGFLAIGFKKGTYPHNLSGKIYYWCMIGVGITAFFIAIPKGNMFLLMIAGFSTYMTLTGYRFLEFRRNPLLRMGRKDQAIRAIGFLTLLVPVLFFSHQGWDQMGGFIVVFGVFGLIMLGMLLGDFRLSAHLSTKSKAWLLGMHISRMMGAFIATCTAFLVQNWQTDPVFIAWLLPTVFFTPLIIYYQKKFRTQSPKLKKQSLH